jgi:hypothetical protein
MGSENGETKWDSLILRGNFKNGNIIKLNVPQYYKQQIQTEKLSNQKWNTHFHL